MEGLQREVFYESLAQPGSEHRAAGRTQGNEGEQSFAPLLAIDVCGERPELGDEGDRKDTGPDVKHHTEIGNLLENQSRVQQPEQHEIETEKQSDPADQVTPGPARGEPRIERDHGEQNQGLGETRIGLDLDLAQAGNHRYRQPSFPHRLDEIVGAQHQEYRGEQQQCRPRFAGAYFGDQGQQALVPRGTTGLGY